jgi:hypothetical protein
MCRNIKRLRHPDHAPTDAELYDAALQFVRKISGFRAPSKAHQAAFDRAVQDVAAAGRVLFESLNSPSRTAPFAGATEVAARQTWLRHEIDAGPTP